MEDALGVMRNKEGAIAGAVANNKKKLTGANQSGQTPKNAANH